VNEGERPVNRFYAVWDREAEIIAIEYDAGFSISPRFLHWQSRGDCGTLAEARFAAYAKIAAKLNEGAV
jgi:hypothetical protein